MKVFIAALLLLVAQIGSANEKGKDQSDFLTEKQKNEFYSLLISEIERLDAEIIETRNYSKSVKWNQFVAYYQPHFQSAKNWQELAIAYDSFAQGLVNLHTRAEFLAVESPSQSVGWLNDEVQFEYPDLKFFLKSNGYQIFAVNGEPISKSLEYFNNYQCRHNNTAGCVASYTEFFNSGGIKVNGKPATDLTLINQKGERIEHPLDYNGKPAPGPDFMAEDYCNKHEGYAGFDTVFEGVNACLYSNGKEAVIRLRHFIYPDHQEPSIYCDSEGVTSSYCSDIAGLLKSLHQLKPEHLIFDMTHNIGGMENSPWLVAFMPKPFKDLPVAYKNTVEITNHDIRNELFYMNPKGETWYQKVKSHKGEYFPVRADFCQGAEDCSLKWIEPRKDHFKADKISIITDWMCVSSCDDFVWRMKDYAKAKVYGIPPAQDATYARIKLYLYRDKNGEIKSKAVGEMTELEAQEGELLLAVITMPYSKSVTSDGKLRNIEPVEMKINPYTLENQSNYSEAVLKELID